MGTVATKYRYAIGAGVIIFSIIAAGFSILYGLIKNAEYDHHVLMDTQEIGHVLILFAQDHQRMPKSFEELYEKNYLKRENDGLLYRGAKVKGREGEGIPYSPLPLENIEKMHIHFGGKGTDKDLFYVPYNHTTIQWSGIITDCLQKALRK
jgi:hypothetical protein